MKELEANQRAGALAALRSGSGTRALTEIRSGSGSRSLDADGEQRRRTGALTEIRSRERAGA